MKKKKKLTKDRAQIVEEEEEAIDENELSGEFSISSKAQSQNLKNPQSQNKATNEDEEDEDIFLVVRKVDNFKDMNADN